MPSPHIDHSIDHSRPDLVICHAELPPELKHNEHRDFAFAVQHWARQRGLATVRDIPSGLNLFTGLHRRIEESDCRALQDWAQAEPRIRSFRLSPPFSLVLLATGQISLEFAMPTDGLLRFLTAALCFLHAVTGGNQALVSGLLAALPLLPQDPPRGMQ